MSRVIEFKAVWKGEVYEVLLIDWLNDLVDLAWENIEIPINEVEFLQYTGHIDAHNIGIFEGDIVEQGKGILFKVVFKGDCWRAEPVDGTRSNRWLSNDLKVVGNIYENPELLEVKK